MFPSGMGSRKSRFIDSRTSWSMEKEKNRIFHLLGHHARGSRQPISAHVATTHSDPALAAASR